MGQRRNILFVQTDAQHHAWLGMRGVLPVRTPNLDALARSRAVDFTRAFTCSGVCVPSRVSTMTGRYPIGHGTTSINIRFRSRTEPWLGELLRDAGYATGYFGKTHFAGDDRDLASEGWSEAFSKFEYNEYLKRHGVDVRYPEKSCANRRPVRYWTVGTSRIPGEHYFENAIADQAVQFIRAHAGRPFACYVSNVAPHGPFTPPPPYDRMYDPAEMPLLPRFDHEIDGKPQATQKWISQNRKYFNDPELRHWLASICGLISLVDDNVGKLLAALDALGLRDDTLVVFTSDHGDFATRYGTIGKSWTMSDDLLRIPLLIALPGAPPRQSDALVRSIDVTATLLDWAGVARPAKMHGRSLLPLLRGQASSVRDRVFAYDQFEYGGGCMHASMIRDARWKYVQTTDHPGELYDLVNDPYETRNLVASPEAAGTRDRLRHELLQWHVDHSGNSFNPAEANFWEDETRFYDERVFCGERISQKRAEDIPSM